MPNRTAHGGAGCPTTGAGSSSFEKRCKSASYRLLASWLSYKRLSVLYSRLHTHWLSGFPPSEGLARRSSLQATATVSLRSDLRGGSRCAGSRGFSRHLLCRRPFRGLSLTLAGRHPITRIGQGGDVPCDLGKVRSGEERPFAEGASDGIVRVAPLREAEFVDEPPTTDYVARRAAAPSAGG